MVKGCGTGISGWGIKQNGDLKSSWRHYICKLQGVVEAADNNLLSFASLCLGTGYLEAHT